MDTITHAKLIDDATNQLLDAYRSLRMSIEQGDGRGSLASQAKEIVDLERELTLAILDPDKTAGAAKAVATAPGTPGPWRADPAGIVRDENREPVARMVSMDEEPTAIDHANARLCAAAPEMLESLRALVLWQDALRSEEGSGLSPRQRTALIEEARAAIAKATGSKA
jgi:hypothetical protein